MHYMRYTKWNANVANILSACNFMMVFGSNDLGGDLSQSDSLLKHALIEVPGIHWHSLDNKDVEKCSG